MKGLVAKVSGDSVEDYLCQRFGDRFREYRRLWQVPEITGEVLDFPVHLDFELNDICNQRCIMCPRNASHLTLYPGGITVNTGQRLGYDAFCRIIDESVPKGVVSINIGAFAEPLIHPEVARMIKYAHDHGIIDSRLITNGVLLKPELAEKILESGLIRLYVSVDAFKPETYKRIRGAGFESVKKNLLHFMRLRNQGKTGGLPWVRVSFVEMPENAAEKEEFIAYWRGKVDHVDIQKYVKPDLVFDQELLKKHKQFKCVDPWRRLSVRANGDILPCCAFSGELLRLGNIRSMTIEQAWRSPKMQEIREGIIHDSSPVCSICQRGIY